MTSNVYKIRLIGGSLMIVLPQRIVREWELVAGDEAVMKTAKHNGSDAIIVEPLRNMGLREQKSKRRPK